MSSNDGRVPPNALEAERSVLGGVLLDNSTFNTVQQLLSPDDFYSEGHKEMYQTMLDLSARGEPLDVVTIRETLAKKGKLQSAGGEDYLLSLTNTIPTIANIESYSKLVREKSVVRKLILACHDVAARGYGDYGEVERYLDQAEKSVFDVAKERASNPYVHIKQVFKTAIHALQEAAARGGNITGLTTGFTRLDAMTAGMHPGDLIIVAGRPGMGKTSFALNVAVNAVKESRKSVAIFSLEMPKEQLGNRILSSEAKVDAGRLRTSRLLREDWTSLTNAAGQISELPIWIDDTPGLTLMELRGKCRRIQAEHGLSLIVIDYLQLMRAGVKTDSREQEISEISRSLKALAKELRVPIIALSQLNRSVETRAGKDKRPQLSDLRESGAIEQDADTILFIFREEVYDKETLNTGVAEIIIGKQRSGPTGLVKCAFFSSFTRFDNLADDYDYGSDEG